MAAWQGRVKENPRQAIMDADALALQLDHLAAYALMRKDEDGSDPERQGRAMRFQTLGAKAGSAVSFLDPELLALPEETLRAMMNDPAFADYSERLRLLLLQ
jgi:oligoendopeptidase F